MAGVRGIRNPFPKKGGSPTGILSTRGKQKQDGASGPHMDVLGHAHSGGGEKSKPKSDNRSLRHQAPAAGSSKKVSL